MQAPTSPPPPAPPAPSARADAVPPPVSPAASPSDAAVTVEIRRQSDGVHLVFPFREPVPAAAFRRADTLWLVFDTAARLDLSRIGTAQSRSLQSVSHTRVGETQIVRVKLERPQLVSLAADGAVWTATIGETVAESPRPLGVGRNVVTNGRSSVTIPYEGPHGLHRLQDPEVGDALIVVTSLGPPRAMMKTQDFVEFRALASSHGLVIQPLADDVQAELGADKVVLTRPGGLTLSGVAPSKRRASADQTIMFDNQLWGFDRQADFGERQGTLMQAAADAAEGRRTAPRLELARFYLARDLYPEAKAVLDVALADERRTGEDPVLLVLRAIAAVMLDRPEQALKDLANPVIGNQFDAPLWRALAHARQGRWGDARDGFKQAEMAIGTLPLEIQRLALTEAVRASIEVRDFGGAASRLDEIETVGVPAELTPTIAALKGRLAEGLGRTEDALNAYRTASESWDRRAAAQGRLREIALRYRLGDLKPQDVIVDLENLTTIWRGDETEIEALAILARLYTDQGRYRDAFLIMRTALTAHPDSEMTRRVHDEAAATFEALFLSPKGDNLAAIDALSLFYDFRELTPIGRRGDEMIRRLSDRLVSVDLLDQAAELLQHQVDHRLQGAARAQVAVRLAVVYLMNRKPERALATLRSTRTADIANELRNQRLLLEARALSDTGRHDLALEVIANQEGREASRLRSDVLWAARRWRESAEQIELMYGDRWKQWEPLDDTERADILRAAVGYGLADDSVGLGRFREKYAGKMVDGADRRAFEIASTPLAGSGAEFRDIARMITAVDTLDDFLRDMRARYPETGAMGAAPGLPPALPAAGKPPVTLPPDQTPTGSIMARPKVGALSKAR
jgi:tetratricopeptide (TPR) repeat protein